MTHCSLPFLRHPLQLLIKCKEKPLGTFRFNAQNAVHNIEAAVGIELQGADKLVAIAIDNPPVAQKRHELSGRFGAGLKRAPLHRLPFHGIGGRANASVIAGGCWTIYFS